MEIISYRFHKSRKAPKLTGLGGNAVQRVTPSALHSIEKCQAHQGGNIKWNGMLAEYKLSGPPGMRLQSALASHEVPDHVLHINRTSEAGNWPDWHQLFGSICSLGLQPRVYTLRLLQIQATGRLPRSLQRQPSCTVDDALNFWTSMHAPKLCTVVPLAFFFFVAGSSSMKINFLVGVISSSSLIT